MNIVKLTFGFARKPDGSISWSWFERDKACCGCTLYWFGPFVIEIIRDEDCLIGDDD